MAGVLGATGILSMWVSNTATAAMMLPIALALAGLAANESDQEHARRFTVAILLAIAFGANIGGIATLVGTPPNALLVLAWWLLARRVFAVGDSPLPGVDDFVVSERAALGGLSLAQRRVVFVVGLAAFGWLTRPLLSAWFPGLALTAAGIAVACALLLFVLPPRPLRCPALLDWRGTRGLSWGVLILVGGGLSLGAAIEASGLAAFIAEQLQGTYTWSIPAVVAMIAVVTVVLSHVRDQQHHDHGDAAADRSQSRGRGGAASIDTCGGGRTERVLRLHATGRDPTQCHCVRQRAAACRRYDPGWRVARTRLAGRGHAVRMAAGAAVAGLSGDGERVRRIRRN